MQESPLATYRRYLAQGKLAYQYDPVTQRAVFPPRVIAPRSGHTDLAWRVSAGAGTVHAITIVRPRDYAPYNVVLVDLDEGFRLMSRVDGIGPQDIRIGMRVRMRAVQPDGDEAPYPVFDVQEPA
jgi:uncharacterized OB-fold protein